MGCGFITQKELINANEVDLNCNITKQLYIENIDKTIKNDHTNNLQGQSADMLIKQKYAAMDFLRILAFFFIILYHFMFELEQKGIFDFKEYAGGYIFI